MTHILHPPPANTEEGREVKKNKRKKENKLHYKNRKYKSDCDEEGLKYDSHCIFSF